MPVFLFRYCRVKQVTGVAGNKRVGKQAVVFYRPSEEIESVGIEKSLPSFQLGNQVRVIRMLAGCCCTAIRRYLV